MKMTFAVIVFLTFFSLSSRAERPEPPEPPELLVALGVTHSFPLPSGVHRVKLTESGLADLTLKTGEGKSSLFVEPKKEGLTDLRGEDENGVLRYHALFRVVSETWGQSIAELRDLVERIPGVDLRVVGYMTYLDGEVDSAESFAKLATITSSLNGTEPRFPVTNLVRLSDEGKKRIADRLRETIRTPDISVRYVGHTVFLEGVAQNDFEADRAVAIARAFLFPGTAKGAAVSAVGLPATDLVDMMTVKAPGSTRKQKK